MKRFFVRTVVVLLGLGLLFFLMRTVPPKLEWHANSCWNNSTFQVLRNVRPLTEELLRARAQADKNGETSVYEQLDDAGTVDLFMKRYVDLLEITSDLKGKTLTQEESAKLEDKRRKFHRQSCSMLSSLGSGSKHGKGDEPRDFMVTFLQGGGLFFSGVKTYEKSRALDGLLKSFFETITGKTESRMYMSSVTLTMLRSSHPDLLREYKKLPQYFVFIRGGYDLSFDLTGFVSKELQKQGEWRYELIGRVCGNPGHVWAYVKDQFEDKPQWYEVNDFTGVVEKKNPPKDREEYIKDGGAEEGPYISVYKRVQQLNDAAVDTLAMALAAMA